MTPTIEAAKLIKRAARKIPKDIADMKHRDFLYSMQSIDKALEMLTEFRPKPLRLQYRYITILKIADENYPQWKKYARDFEKQIVPRHVTMYLLRKYTGKTLASIGELCSTPGNKYDHTTVINAVRSVERAIETRNEAYLNCLDTMTSQLFNYDSLTELPTN